MIPCICGEKGELEESGKKTILGETAGENRPEPMMFQILACNWCGRQALFRLLEEEDEYYEI